MRRGSLASVLLVAALALGPNALAVPGSITLASTSDTGTKGNGGSRFASLSADGTKVAFYSSSTNLDPADSDAFDDVFVKDLATGELTLVSTSDTGVKGNSHSFFPSLSADGTRVVFVSYATNLDPVDTDFLGDVYVKNLVTGDIILVSTSDTGMKGNGGNSFPSLSADGTKVAFESTSSNLDPADSDAITDVFVKDLVTGDITLASTSDTGVKGNDHSSSFFVTLSADGAAVAFVSNATNLDPADTDNTADIYVKNVLSGDLFLASTSDTGIKGNGSSIFVFLSADGTKVAYISNATNLDPGDSDGIYDVYVKDVVSGDLTLASTSDSGVKGNSHASLASLSSDGMNVAFASTATNLDPADSDAITDVFVKDLVTGDIALASTSDGGDKGNDFSTPGTLSADGTMVAFESSATNLELADPDSLRDVYVKELGGPPPPQADVGVTMADKPDPVVGGQTLSYRMTITNHGPAGATGVILTDTFPGGTRFVSVSTSQGGCTTQIKEGVVICSLGDLSDGASATVRLVVRPQRTGTITNTASVSANEPDPDSANNSDAESTSVLAG